MQFLQIFILLLRVEATEGCDGPLERDDVIACARASSPSVAADRERVAVARGDERSARVMLPSNPEVGFSAAYRRNDVGENAVNLYGTLSQEIEVAGQRRRRIATATAEREAASQRVEVTERDAIAEALIAYYEAIAARRELEVLESTRETTELLEKVARERARAGSAAPIEIDLAEAEKAGVHEQVELARGRMEQAQTRLAVLVGLRPGARPEVRGDLDPMPAPTGLAEDDELANLPELTLAASQTRAASARLELLRRERAPNLRLQFIVQQDGFNELVVGGGVSLPIPLPAPLGRTNKGAIEAARASIREAEARRAAVKRTVTLEVALAERELLARKRAVAAYDDAAIERARTSLQDLADQASAGRIDLRSALITQRTLLELLLRQVRARYELCRASVELARATNTLKEGRAR